MKGYHKGEIIYWTLLFISILGSFAYLLYKLKV